MKRKLATLILAAVMLILCACSAVGTASDHIKGGYDNDAPKDEYYRENISSGMLDLSDTDSTQKLIRTCQIDAETLDFDKTTDNIVASIQNFGGYIESQSSRGSSYSSSGSHRYLSLTVRIPAESFGDFVNSLDGIMNVTRCTSNAENVTEAYYDTEARLTTLKAERESLQKMMASIDNSREYEFWLTMQTRLSEIEQDIASLEAKLRTYDSRVSYSTVSISLTEVATLTDDGTNTFGDRVSEAFTASWQAFVKFWQDAAVFIVSLLPTLAMLALIAAIVFLIIFIATRKKKH